ncbi:hypothetical protein [Tolypothrix sp. VBCCA 56010]|uniref:hypothetical protein n=1 Tax=Tolypothrix sp. VBCCA 56010 TaxID=3137731 RepID=UPI003D7DB029
MLSSWIVDYLAIASRNYLGNPKVPSVFVYQLINGEYQVQQIRSPIALSHRLSQNWRSQSSKSLPPA